MEQRGRGRGRQYILSRSLYSSLGRAGAYTRKRGLDRETNKALLMQHLTDSGAEGAPIRDLLQVLPALSRDQVKRLLKELAVEGRAQVIGVTRAGRWFAVDSTGQIGSASDDDPTNAPKATQ